MPAAGSSEHEQYLQWLHYAEGSAMLPLMLRMYTGRLPDGGAALQPRINDELNRHLGYMNRALDGVEWFVGNTIFRRRCAAVAGRTGALLHPEGVFPNLAAMRERFQAQPAYQRALKGGKYDFGPPASKSISTASAHPDGAYLAASSQSVAAGTGLDSGYQTRIKCCAAHRSHPGYRP